MEITYILNEGEQNLFSALGISTKIKGDKTSISTKGFDKLKRVYDDPSLVTEVFKALSTKRTVTNFFNKCEDFIMERYKEIAAAANKSLEGYIMKYDEAKKFEEGKIKEMFDINCKVPYLSDGSEMPPEIDILVESSEKGEKPTRWDIYFAVKDEYNHRILGPEPYKIKSFDKKTNKYLLHLSKIRWEDESDYFDETEYPEEGVLKGLVAWTVVRDLIKRVVEAV